MQSLKLAMDSSSVSNWYSPSPSPLYPRHLQLPLCLLVRHSVSMVPVPVDKTLAVPSSSSLFGETAGNRNDWTWPPDRPTATIGSLG
jgi:hypothetical protein